MEEDHNSHGSPLIDPSPRRGFVQTNGVKEIIARGLNYIRSGFPVHFRGPTGTGKTTLALHLARKLRQPVVLIHGDAKFTTADLIGKSDGYKYKRHVDEFVRGVSRTEESMSKQWLDHRLTFAVRNGYTLIYDEFTRSQPEANNVLLAVLQEKVLDFPQGGSDGEHYVPVHPDFKAIFTSNPEEYAGVYSTQDALLDRMITMHLGHYDKETEVKITSIKSRLSEPESEAIVNIARELRSMTAIGHLPSIRGCIMVARSTKKHRDGIVSRDSHIFRNICKDVFLSELERSIDKTERGQLVISLDALIDRFAVPVAPHDESFTMPLSISDKNDLKVYYPEDALPENKGAENNHGEGQREFS
jgi:nitric oxide reductase NorQ protein